MNRNLKNFKYWLDKQNPDLWLEFKYIVIEQLGFLTLGMFADKCKISDYITVTFLRFRRFGSDHNLDAKWREYSFKYIKILVYAESELLGVTSSEEVEIVRPRSETIIDGEYRLPSMLSTLSNPNIRFIIPVLKLAGKYDSFHSSEGREIKMLKLHNTWTGYTLELPNAIVTDVTMSHGMLTESTDKFTCLSNGEPILILKGIC